MMPKRLTPPPPPPCAQDSSKLEDETPFWLTYRQASELGGQVRKGEKSTIVVFWKWPEKPKATKRDDDKRLAAKPVNDSQDELGLRVQAITPEIARQFGYDETESGVLVGRVKAASKAGEAGVQTGDIIKEINRQAVKGLTDYDKYIKKGLKSDSISLLIKRRNAGYLAVKINP